MTVSVEVPITNQVYSGVGDYDFNFTVYTEEDLVVKHLSSAGVITLLELGTDYEVALNDPGPGGTVTTLAAFTPTSGTLTIYSSFALAQATEWETVGRFNTEQLERDLDRIYLILQQYDTKIANELESMSWEGDWATATAYEARALVKYSGDSSIYFCLTEHTSGTFATDLAAGYWALLMDFSILTTAEVNAEASATAAEEAQTAAEAAQTAAELAQAACEEYVGQRDNLLINPECTIDQEGGSNGTAIASGDYGFDMWKSAVNGSTITKTGDAIVVSGAGAQFAQYSEKLAAYHGQPVVASCTSGVIELTGGAGSSTITVTPSTPHTFTLNMPSATSFFRIGEGTDCEGLKVEPGTVPTPFVRRSITEEQLLCYRYSFVVCDLGLFGYDSGGDIYAIPGIQALIIGSTLGFGAIETPVPMRNSITFDYGTAGAIWIQSVYIKPTNDGINGYVHDVTAVGNRVNFKLNSGSYTFNTTPPIDTTYFVGMSTDKFMIDARP